MITELRLKNFKAWRDTGSVRLAPLTVFFGTNSSGKTSITQLLLMLKQTAESPDRRRVLHPGDSKTLVDLGTFHDLVFNHKRDDRLSFHLRWSLPQILKVKDPQSESTCSGKELMFEATIQEQHPETEGLTVGSLAYTLGDPRNSGLRIRMACQEEKPEKYDMEAEGYKLVRNPGRPWPLPPPVRFYGFPDEAVAFYQNTGFLPDLTLELERLLRGLCYLGPLREYPKRTYVWSGEDPEHVGWRGERSIEALLAARKRRLSRGPHKRTEPFEGLVARWLEGLGLIESFQVRPIARHRKEYEVLVRTSASRQNVGITDVGFGVSQVLPVVVQCFYAKPSSTIIFEQPEIHLHPRVQAALADLFIEVIHTREEGKNRNVQIIVESHSEHFLRRLQRRIAEEELAPEEAALYFCELAPDGAVMTELDVDPCGNISNWPEGFFGDDMEDLAAMTDAAMRRERKG